MIDSCCEERLSFQTKQHQYHICIHPLAHEGKHECLCGVTWTRDPCLAGTNWSSEQVIYDSSNPPNDPNRDKGKNSEHN